MSTLSPAPKAAGLAPAAASDELLARFASLGDKAAPFELMKTALATFGDGLRVACSFGVEDMLLVHETVRAARELDAVPRIFLLDTGRLHQETYDLLDRARDKYGVPFEVYAPDTVAVEELVRRDGPNSFYRSVDDRKGCCDIRKVRPLKRALAGASAWVTGMRRSQSTTRSALEIAERDEGNGGILKLSPLAAWEEPEVWAFVKENRVPVHALHAKGYPSIGCAPCTRAIEPGEDVRAGRWWWESPDHKECGLHARGRG